MKWILKQRAKAQQYKLFHKKGLLTLLVGAGLILPLIISTIISFFIEMDRIDFKGKRQPPSVLSLQILMDKSVYIKHNEEIVNLNNSMNNDFIMDDFSFGMDDFSPEPENKKLKTNEWFVISSHPPRAANLINRYSYKIRLNDDASAESVRFSLGISPTGMIIDEHTGFVSWEPKQTGEFKVQIDVNDGIRRGAQEYKVVVSEQPHILGTTSQGYDILNAIFIGARSAFIPSIFAVSIMMILGVTFGALGGYFGGFINQILTYISSVISSFPRLVLIFLIASIFRLDIYLTMLVVGIIYFPQFAAQIKEKIIHLKKNQFIEAAKELGLNNFQIIFKHILWYNCRPILFSQISFGFASAILMEVTLSYLGFGVQTPYGSWGKMISQGKDFINQGEYWHITFPAIAIIVSILGLFMLGDGLNRFYALKEDDG